MKVQFHLVVLTDHQGIIVEWASEYVIRRFLKVYALSADNIKLLAAISQCFSNLSHTVRKPGATKTSLHFNQLLLAVCKLTPCIFANVILSRT